MGQGRQGRRGQGRQLNGRSHRAAQCAAFLLPLCAGDMSENLYSVLADAFSASPRQCASRSPAAGATPSATSSADRALCQPAGLARAEARRPRRRAGRQVRGAVFLYLAACAPAWSTCRSTPPTRRRDRALHRRRRAGAVLSAGPEARDWVQGRARIACTLGGAAAAACRLRRLRRARAGRPRRLIYTSGTTGRSQGRDADPRQPGLERARAARGTGAGSRATCCCTRCRSSTCTACSSPRTARCSTASTMIWLARFDAGAGAAAAAARHGVHGRADALRAAARPKPALTRGGLRAHAPVHLAAPRRCCSTPSTSFASAPATPSSSATA